MKPSKFGYSLSALVDGSMVDALETDREESLQWAQSKLKNPKRSTEPEPWEEVAEGQFKVKFSWNEDNKPPVVDTEGSPVTDENTPMYSGSRVKLRSIRSLISSRTELLTARALNWLVYNWCLSIQELV